MAAQQPGKGATSREELPGNYEPMVNEHFQAPAHNLDSKQAEQIIRLAESSHKDAQGGSMGGNFGKREHHGQSASEFAGPNAGILSSGSTGHGSGIPETALGGSVHGRREHHGMSSSEFAGPANPIPAQRSEYPSQTGNVGANRSHHGMSASEYLPEDNTKPARDLGRSLHNPATYTDKPRDVSSVAHPQVAAVEPGGGTSTAHYDLSSMGANARGPSSGHDGHLHSTLGAGAGAGALAGAAAGTQMHPTGHSGSTTGAGSLGLAEAAGTTGPTVPGAGSHGVSSGHGHGHGSGEQSIADKLRGELERNAQKAGTRASGMGTHGAAKEL